MRVLVVDRVQEEVLEGLGLPVGVRVGVPVGEGLREYEALAEGVVVIEGETTEVAEGEADGLTDCNALCDGVAETEGLTLALPLPEGLREPVRRRDALTVEVPVDAVTECVCETKVQDAVAVDDRERESEAEAVDVGVKLWDEAVVDGLGVTVRDFVGPAGDTVTVREGVDAVKVAVFVGLIDEELEPKIEGVHVRLQLAVASRLRLLVAEAVRVPDALPVRSAVTVGVRLRAAVRVAEGVPEGVAVKVGLRLERGDRVPVWERVALMERLTVADRL